MLHARPDYQRIQDPAGSIPEDEPVFLLRGQDLIAPYVLMDWARRAEKLGMDPKMVQMARDHASAMWRWQNEQKRKLPDLPVIPT